jgi:hypothetical protein
VLAARPILGRGAIPPRQGGPDAPGAIGGAGGAGGAGGNGDGAAFYTASGSVSLSQSTVAANNAGGGTGGAGASGGPGGKAGGTSGGSAANGSTGLAGAVGQGIAGGLQAASGTTSLVNTIVATNVATSDPDLAGAFTSHGGNLIGNGSGSSGLTNASGGDQVGSGTSPLNPMLGPLQNNGGPTETMALLPGSPALAAGSSSAGLTVDQRGFLRASPADSGAFQLNSNITGLSVPGGALAGGTSVVITGSNLAAVSAVYFGTEPATSFVINSPTTITAVSPAGTTTVEVTVNTPQGTSLKSPYDQYIYFPANLPTVANNLTHSDEAYGRFVTNAYEEYLGRAPSAAEVAGWVSHMDVPNGYSDEVIEATFISSTEYIADHGGLGAGWVTAMYQNLLDRTPGQSEVDGWVTDIANGDTPYNVAYGFAHGIEREGNRITSDYVTYLGRVPSAAERNAWVNFFESASSPGNETVVAGFIGGPEYWVVHGSAAAAWINAVYMDVLGRSPSTAEVDALLPILTT